MANALFAKGREGFLDGSIDWDTHDIKAVLVDSSADTINVSTDDNLDDILLAARIATSSNFASKTVANGTADAADITFTPVTGDYDQLVIYKDTGVASTSRLIAFFDTITGFPGSSTGGTVSVAWHASGIFTL